MALDTANKRGSVIGLSLPFRQWLATPDGTLASTDRASLLKMAATITPDAPVEVSSPITHLTGNASRQNSLTGNASP